MGMQGVKKLSDEMWTDYVARRLEDTSIGVYLTPYVRKDGFDNSFNEYSRIYRGEKWVIDVGFIINNSPFKNGGRNHPGLPYPLRLEDILMESVLISCLDKLSKGNDGSVLFEFKGNNVMVVDADDNMFGLLGPLDRYLGREPSELDCPLHYPKNRRTYPARKFVDDLALFVKQFAGTPNLAYQKIGEGFLYQE